MSQSSQHQATKAWELSLYELHRKPQEVITDDTQIAISPRSLHSELMCPICLDMLTNTMTTKECLHRFCHDCIITALRSGNKECPTCRKKLISKRSLRPDPNFDSLIEKIYPDRDEYEEHQAKVLEKLNQHTNQQALTMSIEEGLRIQAQNRLQRMLKQQKKAEAEVARQTEENPSPEENGADDARSENAETPTSSAPPKKVGVKRKASTHSEPTTPGAVGSTSSQEEGQNSQEEISEFELIFRPHPDHADENDPFHRKRYIKTTANASMGHLAKFLSVRNNIEKQSTGSADGSQETELTYMISIVPPGETEHQELSGELSLEQVHGQFWKENRPMDMFFKPVS